MGLWVLPSASASSSFSVTPRALCSVLPQPCGAGVANRIPATANPSGVLRVGGAEGRGLKTSGTRLDQSRASW